MIGNEQRQLKTITFRNLDSRENQDVSQIINDFMQEYHLESVQKTLEQIIRRYARNRREDKLTIEKLESELAMTRDLVEILETKLEDHKTVTNMYRIFQKQLNNLEP